MERFSSAGLPMCLEESRTHESSNTKRSRRTALRLVRMQRRESPCVQLFVAAMSSMRASRWTTFRQSNRRFITEEESVKTTRRRDIIRSLPLADCLKARISNRETSYRAAGRDVSRQKTVAAVALFGVLKTRSQAAIANLSRPLEAPASMSGKFGGLLTNRGDEPLSGMFTGISCGETTVAEHHQRWRGESCRPFSIRNTGSTLSTRQLIGFVTDIH